MKVGMRRANAARAWSNAAPPKVTFTGQWTIELDARVR
jgi:hypothetical protein